MGSVFLMITVFKVPTSLLDTFCYCHSLTEKKGKKIKERMRDYTIWSNFQPSEADSSHAEAPHHHCSLF